MNDIEILCYALMFSNTVFKYMHTKKRRLVQDKYRRKRQKKSLYLLQSVSSDSTVTSAMEVSICDYDNR